MERKKDGRLRPKQWRQERAGGPGERQEEESGAAVDGRKMFQQ